MSDPTTLGSYTVESVIFRGAHATSYLGSHSVMRGQRVVLRVLNPEAAADPDRVARFETEARNAARLKHECVAGVVDLQRDGDQPFLVLEYAEGLDVSTILNTFGAMPPGVAAAIAREVLRGLEHAHGLGMMHSKLRPRRVKVSPEGGVKLLGLGVRDSDGANENDTDAAYMAPEVVTGGGESVQADLYSVGMLMYHMLSARVPARGSGRPAPLAEANPIVPRPLSDVVDYLLEQAPNARPADAKTARLALEDVLDAMRVVVGSDLIRDYLANPKAFTEKSRQDAIVGLLRVARDIFDGPPPDPMAARKLVERVLSVDPGNEAATHFLSEIDGAGGDRTMMMPAGGFPDLPPRATPPPAAAAPPPAPPAPSAPKPEVKSEVKPASTPAPPVPKSEVKPAAPAAPKSELKPGASAAKSEIKSELKPSSSKAAAAAPPPPAPKKAAAAPPPPAEKKPAAAPAPKVPVGLFVGIGVVVIALVVALVLVLGKKKPAEVAAPETPAVPTGSLDVSTEPTGAVVTVEAGGASQSNTSNTTFDNLAEGTARVRVELAGFLARETTLAVTAGSPQSLHVKLLPDVAAQVCSLYVTVTPRADKVLLNGKPASGKDAFFWGVLPAGRYKVEASAAGFTTALATGKTLAGEVKKLSLTLASAPATPATPATPEPTPVAAVAEPADGVPARVEVAPAADIYVDDVLRAKSSASLDLKLSPGKHAVRFEHPDFVKVRKELQIKAGKAPKPLRVDLAAGEGILSISGGKPGLKIFLDGKSTGVTTPGVVRGVKPGRHTVDLREANGATVVSSQSVVVADSPVNQPVKF
ncbi:MAG: protein kinase [Candidatus Eisenbacteria bacterium]